VTYDLMLFNADLAGTSDILLRITTEKVYV